MEIRVMANILENNDKYAAAVRQRLADNKVFAVNMMGSPGCGKTSLLERTISALQNELKLAVIEGDLFTAKDAERVERCGVPVVQINTGGGCHLDANMVNSALDSLALDKLDLVIIENVGNLVCPAEFDLGEDIKVAILSTTEGEDKPLKYPLAFQKSSAALLNKIDLLPYTCFDLTAVEKDIYKLNPSLMLFKISCRTNEGLNYWYDWLIRQVEAKNHTKESS